MKLNLRQIVILFFCIVSSVIVSAQEVDLFKLQEKEEKEYLNKGWRYLPSISLSYNLKVRFAQLFEARTKGGWKYDEISPYLQEFAVRGGMNIEQMLLKYARPVSQVDANGDKVVVYTKR